VVNTQKYQFSSPGDEFAQRNTHLLQEMFGTSFFRDLLTCFFFFGGEGGNWIIKKRMSPLFVPYQKKVSTSSNPENLLRNAAIPNHENNRATNSLR